jgi:hypothetical protein
MLSITLHGFSRGLSRFLLSELSLPILSLFFVPFWLIIIGGVAAFAFGIFCSFVAFKYMIVLEKYIQSLKNKDMKEFEITKEEEISKEFFVDSEMLNTGSEATFAIPTETATEHTTDNTQTETETKTESSIKSENKSETTTQPSSVEM